MAAPERLRVLEPVARHVVSLRAYATPDVEALLLRRDDDKTACYLVPIDACYELVGLVKMHWRGFSGGETVWREIDAFFAGLQERSQRVGSSARQ